MAGRRWTASSLLLRLRQEHTVLGRDVDTDVDVDSDLGPTQKRLPACQRMRAGDVKKAVAGRGNTLCDALYS